GDEQPSPYLFDAARSGPGRFLADALIKSKPAVHKRRMLKPLHRTPEFCAACHKVSLDRPVNGYRYLRGQDEYDHWLASGVAHGSAATFYLPPEPKRCQDCHMPYIPARLPDVSSRNGRIRSHLFLAVNDALPHLRGDDEMRERIYAFLRDWKLRVDVFALEFPGRRVRALDVSRPVLVAGETVVFEVVVRNLGVGHTFPGGTNDSNQAWIEFTITDEDSNVLGRRGWVDEEGYVDRKAHFYRVVFVREDGTAAMRRDAQNFRAVAYQRVIGPGKADLARYAFPVPAAAVGRKLTIRARLRWRKFNRDYVKFVFGEQKLPVPDLPRFRGKEIPDLPVTTIAESSVTLEVAADWREPRAVRDPALWERYNDHGIANLEQGAFNVAQESFAGVARLRPDLPDGYRNQARRWLRSAAPDRALLLLQKVEEVAPLDPQRSWFWGRYFERTEQFERSEEAYRDSVDVFPRDREGWRRLGKVRFKLHRYEEALEAYLRLLEIDNEDFGAHEQRLLIYRLLGRDREAAEAAKAFEKYRPDDLADQWTNEFRRRHPEINESAQARHVYPLD
ncbi:MAG: tetratricopeptide repeat protein, partial [Planctomycetota bacterium]